jgi:hypothetical protein
MLVLNWRLGGKKVPVMFVLEKKKKSWREEHCNQ